MQTGTTFFLELLEVTPNCNNVVIEKSKKAKSQIGINQGNLNFDCSQILYMNEKCNVNE